MGYLGSTNYIINKARGSYGFRTNIFNKKVNTGTLLIEPSDPRYCDVRDVYRAFHYGSSNKDELLARVIAKYRTGEGGIEDTINSTEVIKGALTSMINFFSEFEFEPNFRFVNTFAYALADSKKSAKDYVMNYFKLTDSQHTNSIIEKMKSAEFDNIMESMKKVAPTHRVNNRFKLYYGSQGTGKTTDALKETGDLCMVCHSAMLPSDLMEDFKFVDGKATFTPSALMKAMTSGTKIVLDEINLLPFESLRFLQSILDGKTEFEYKGTTVKIADGFQIIGTMNLVVNDSVYALPAPLVDRCQNIKNYKLTADALVGAII